MKRTFTYFAGAVILMWGALAYGPDLLGVSDSTYGDDSGLSRRLDILPWIGLLFLGYLLVAAVVELGIRSRRKSRSPHA